MRAKMKNIKFISPLILSLGYLLIFAQSLKGQFKPAARVILSDNTVIELSNFEIHSYHSRLSKKLFKKNEDTFKTR